METVATWYLDKDGEPTETEHGAVRVRLDYDEFPWTMSEQGDFLPLIVHIDPHVGRVYHKVEAGEQYADGIDGSDIARAWEHFRDVELVARWLRICYGVHGVDVWDDPRSASRWFAIATKTYMKETMGEEVTAERVAEVLKSDVEFIENWATGQIYRWVIERLQTGQKVYDDDDIDDEPFEEWEVEDTCSGYVGYQYAREAALAALGYTPKGD